MTLLLNLLGVFGCVIILIPYYFCVKVSSNKLVTTIKALVCIIVWLFVYSMIQPSYIPKTTVKRLPITQFESKEIEVKDLTVKEKERNINEILTVRDEVKETLNK